MARNSKKFDKTQPHAKCRSTGNDHRRAFLQNGMYFNAAGKYVEDADGKPADAYPSTAPEAARLSDDDKKREALTAAAARLNKVVTVGAVPDAVQDAAKENAEALAAEDNA